MPAAGHFDHRIALEREIPQRETSACRYLNDKQQRLRWKRSSAVATPLTPVSRAVSTLPASFGDHLGVLNATGADFLFAILPPL
jgi:hypothetical protein